MVLGISKDTVEKQARFRKKYDLPFPLLSDVDKKVCAAYDVIKGKNMYGKKVMGIERSTFVIGPDGTVERIYRKVKADGHVADILAAL